MTTKEFLHAEDFVLYGNGGIDENYARYVIHNMRLPYSLQAEFDKNSMSNLLMCEYESKSFIVTGVTRSGLVILEREELDRSIRISVNIAECSGWHRGDK